MKKIFFISILVLSFSKINAQESDDFMYMNAFIIVADTSESYEILHKKMYELSSKLNFEVDTMGRGYDKNKGLICLPENHEDEIYAGDYFPRRYPSDKLSLEYLDYYKKGNKPSGGIIALVIAITDKKEHAESILKKVQTQEKMLSYWNRKFIWAACINSENLNFKIQMKKYIIILFCLLNLQSLYSQEIKEKQNELSITDTSRKVYYVVDEMPKYDKTKDLDDTRIFLQQNLRLPDSIECYIYRFNISFIIEPNGSISNEEIIMRNHCDAETEEAFRKAFMDVLKNIPEFEPGKLNGKYVPVKFVMPMNVSYQ